LPAAALAAGWLRHQNRLPSRSCSKTERSRASRADPKRGSQENPKRSSVFEAGRDARWAEAAFAAEKDEDADATDFLAS
jgi:hypothetical protein